MHGRPVDPLRLRPNLVVATEDSRRLSWPEFGWVGRRLRVGPDAVLALVAPMPRCVMLDLAQADLPADRGLLQAVHDASDGELGVVADVVRPGRVSVGDVVTLQD